MKGTWVLFYFVKGFKFCVIEICVESFAASQGVGFSFRLYIVIIYPSSENVLFDHIQ